MDACYLESRDRPQIEVLLVEDNGDMAWALSEQLASLTSVDVRCERVSLLADALDRLQTRAYDAVLLDLGLPDSAGLTTVERVIEQSPYVPVVVLTGRDDDDLATRALQQGAQDFLVKGQSSADSVARTLRHAIERARLQAQIQLLVAKNHDAMIVVDPQATIRYANEAAKQMLGHGGKDLVGSRFPYSIAGDETIEIEAGRPELGEGRIGEMRVSPVSWNGSPASLVSIRDVTDLVRARELERQLMHRHRLAAVGKLAAGVAHEINNPANFVLSNLATVLEQVQQMCGLRSASADPDSQADTQTGTALLFQVKEMLAECVTGVERIARTVRDLSTFSGIQRGDIEQIDLNEVIRFAARLTENEIRHRAKLVMRLGTLPRIAGDSSSLTQIFINLLINAAHGIDEAKDGPHRIEVTTMRRDSEIVAVVSDTGRGIPPEHLDRVLEPFFTTKSRGQGTGLGLSIAAESARQHGGELRLTSTVGAGTRVEVVLPVESNLSPEDAPQQSAALRPAFEDAPRSERAARPARVLIVEDEEILLRAFARLLEADYEVVTATDGRSALDLLDRDRNFGAIVCDLMMPGMSGPALYARLADSAPQLLDCMIFVTGGAITEHAQRFTAIVDAPVLTKPISAQHLREVVAATVGTQPE